MYLNQAFGIRQAVLACATLMGLLAVSGCAMLHRGEQAAAAPPPVAQPAETTAAPEPQTVTEAVGEAPDEAGTTTVISDAGSALKPSAPKSYVVRRGDTLWGIANIVFARSLAVAGDLVLNPDIQNPHRIYPGDTVRLALGATAVPRSRSCAVAAAPRPAWSRCCAACPSRDRSQPSRIR